MAGFANGGEHLLAELTRLDLLLQRQVVRLRAARLLVEDEYRGLYLPEAQIDAILECPERFHRFTSEDPPEVHALTERIEQLAVQNGAREFAAERAGVLLPLRQLEKLFGLSRYERDVLLLCIAPELDTIYETLCAYVQNDVNRKRPSVDLALKLFCSTWQERLNVRSAFFADAPLWRASLVAWADETQVKDPTSLGRALKADPRILNYLLEKEVLDERLAGFTRLAAGGRRFQPLALSDSLRAALTPLGQTLRTAGGFLLFYGPQGVGKRTAATALCTEQGMPLLVADMIGLLASELPLTTTLTLLKREAILRGAGLYLNRFEALLAEAIPPQRSPEYVLQALDACPFPIFLGSDTEWYPAGLRLNSRFFSFEFALPAFPLRLRLWQEALRKAEIPAALNGEVTALADKFRLTAGQINNTARAVHHWVGARNEMQPPPDAIARELHAAARAQSGQGLRHLTQKVESVYAWDDIVLPPRQMQQLRDICTSVRYRHVVYTHWGFDSKRSLGKGLDILFTGASGTGKTMAASILARQLELDLYKIELSSVVSKYIGETEKNLSRIFQEARASNAILFFDEADALFGKRSEVKDALDRYANIEVAYLLQQIETYDGIVILATNLSKNIDEAFARRMHHMVEFPFPDPPYRERIWRGVFPAAAPLAAKIDFPFLAQQFEIAGGNIRNIALAAAFRAAEENRAIQMEDLVLATAQELQKIGKLPAKSDFLQYYELIRERA